MSTVQTRRTLKQLRQLVRRRVPTSDADTQLTYDVLDEFINIALQQVAVEHGWPWLLTSATLTTTAGDGNYDVPANWLQTDTIVDTTNAITLRHINRRELNEITVASTGAPTLYVISAEQVELRLIPDAAYTLTHWYYRMEPTLVGDTSTPLIPLGYDEGVVEYAAYLALRFKQEEQRAVFARKAYDDWVKRTADNITQSRETRAPRVRPGNIV